MPKTLGFHVGYRVVSLALDRVTGLKEIVADTTLDSVLTSSADQHAFRQALAKELKTYTKGSAAAKLNVRVSAKLHELAKTVASLPGDPTTDPPDPPKRPKTLKG